MSGGCQSQMSLDIPQIASLNSQLAGVLAGFAFTGIIFIITTRLTVKSDQPVLDNSTYVLITGLMGLVMSSINYSVVSGDSYDAGRSELIDLVAEIGFVTAGPLIVYVVLLMLMGKAEPRSHRSIASIEVIQALRFILIVAIPSLLIALVFAATTDPQAVGFGPKADVSVINYFGLPLCICQLVFSIAVWSTNRRPSRVTKLDQIDRHSRRIRRYANFCLLIILTCTGFVAIASALMGPCQTFGVWVPIVGMTVGSVVLCTSSVHIARTRW